MVAIEPSERETPHEFGVDVLNPSGVAAGKIRGAVQVGATAGETGEVLHLPLTLDLRSAPVAEAGWYSIKVALDSEPMGELRVTVDRQEPTGARPRARRDRPN